MVVEIHKKYPPSSLELMSRRIYLVHYRVSWRYTRRIAVPASKVFTLVKQPDGAVLHAGQLNKEE